MLDAIDQIERYAVRGRDAIASEELVRVWVVHHLQVLCEAAAALGREFHSQHPDIPWASMVAMRNVLVHDYGGVDVDEVWRTVERDLPPLKQELAKLVDELGGGI
jgi:uncharacterized protein with HEPN domain